MGEKENKRERVYTETDFPFAFASSSFAVILRQLVVSFLALDANSWETPLCALCE